MPGKPDKKHRIRVTTIDGKPRDQGALNKLKSNQLGMPHLDIVATNVTHELIICAPTQAHLEQLKGKLGGVGLEPVDGGDTTIAVKASEATPRQGGRPHERVSGKHRDGGAQRSGAQQHAQAPAHKTRPLLDKPYGFVGLPKEFTTAAPVWHDGTTHQGLLSGEIRFELETLTPMLVGWERQPIVTEGGGEPEWPIQHEQEGAGVSVKLSGRRSDPIAPGKSVLCPLRAPWGKGPVVIPGDSLKGLLRHELGALLGAPMERVAERSYSYRPNAMFPLQTEERILIPRLARVLEGYVQVKPLDDGHQVRVPTCLELFSETLEYNKKSSKFDYRFDQPGGASYRGGQGAGKKLNAKSKIHTSLNVLSARPIERVDVPQSARDGYLASVQHLVDPGHGHFSERHPDVPKTITGEEARKRVLKAVKDEVFQPGDLIWVEWDTEKKCIVSFGWHYYYRWAYIDSVRRKGGKLEATATEATATKLERHGLFPLEEEKTRDREDAPTKLSLVRRLFGYTGDNDGSSGIGNKDHSQLMGRVFVNSGLEVVGENDSDDERFLKPTFLKELGMPRPSAVEHYLKQNLDPEGRPQKRPSDQATLVTYGDAAGYDEPGELAGRKFYLDRKDAYDANGEARVPGPAADPSQVNRLNERSTLALKASKPGRRFRFTVRFRDLEPCELAAVMVALCPDQFKGVLGGDWKDGYCSKLGYARPLGWGSVRIEAKQLLLLDEEADTPTLRPESNPADWVKNNHKPTMMQKVWLEIHHRKHPNAKDYPEQADKNGQKNIYTYHSTLRAEHSRARRYRNK